MSWSERVCVGLICEVERGRVWDTYPLPSGRDHIVERVEWKAFVDELRAQWKSLWRDRIDDKVKAEGIAREDYSPLFVDRGTVIVATRDFKPLDFVEILECHKPSEVLNGVPPHPAVGGWGRFIRDFIGRERRFTKRGRPVPSEPKREEDQQRKKGGRGWLHVRME